MGKFLVFLVASADGYYEGPNGEFDWPVVDAEFNAFATEQLDSTDTMVFGRVTYGGMAAWWPTESARTNDPEVARRMNEKAKIVVSRTLERADWEHTRVFRTVDELAALKEEPGGNVIIMGSSNLAASLLDAGLVDELRIMVMPVLLGGGKSLLHTVTGRVPLTLLGVTTFKSGNVWLTYQPGRTQD
jgi:dihydrofolate reductase